MTALIFAVPSNTFINKNSDADGNGETKETYVRLGTLAREPDYLDRLIDEKEAALFLGYTIRALQGWRIKGGGPTFIKVSARSIRYRRRDLIEWAEARLAANTSQFVGGQVA